MITPQEVLQQISSLRKLRHPRIVSIIGLATDGLNNWGLLMESMPRTMERMLARVMGSEETARASSSRTPGSPSSSLTPHPRSHLHP